MKNTLFYLSLISCLFTQLSAQPLYTIVNGSSTGNDLPMDPFYGYSYSEQIYLSSEIGVAGDITEVQFEYNGYQAFTDNIQIYIGHTTKSSYSSTSDWIKSGNMTLVYDGPMTVGTSSGWVNIVLDQSFTYNGSDNLVIAVDENTSGYHSSGASFYTASVANYRSLVYRNDNTNPNPASPPSATYRQADVPSLQLNISTGPVIQCSQANITDIDACAGGGASASVSFTVTGSSLTNNITVSAPLNYEVSTDNVNFSQTVVLTQSGGSVNSTVYARLQSGLAQGSYSGAIIASSSNASDQFVNVSGNVSSNNIYVNAASAGGGNGTSSSPYNNLADALNLASTNACGATTIHVASGTYNDAELTINQADLTIEGNANTNTIFDGSNNNLRFMKVDADNFTLRNIQIKNYGVPVACNVAGSCNGGAVVIGEAGIFSLSNILLESLHFNNNLTDGTYGCGGALFIDDDAIVTINSSKFNNNYAGDPGTTGSNVVNNGGAIYCLGEATINNSLFFDNISKGYGSAIFMEGLTAMVDLYHCTVSRNNARGNYGALAVKNGNFSVYNSIAYNNVHGITFSTGHDLYESSGLMNVSYSCYGDDYFNRSATSNCITNDPLFVNSSSNFNLQAGSPVIDAGISGYGLSTDIQGLSRPSGAGYDMGAYEYQSCQAPVMATTVIEDCANNQYSVEVSLSSYGDGTSANISDGTTTFSNVNLGQIYSFGPYSIANTTSINANAAATGGCISYSGNLSGCVPNICVDALDLYSSTINADFSLANNDSQESDDGGEPNYLQVGNGTTIASCAWGTTHNAYDYTEYKDLWFKVTVPAGQDNFSISFTNVTDHYVIVPYYGACGSLTQMTLLYNSNQAITGVVDNNGDNWYGDDPYITPSITTLDFKGDEILNAPGGVVYLRVFPYDGGVGGSAGCSGVNFSSNSVGISSSVPAPVTRTTVKSGNWSSAATWDCNCIPAATDMLVINHNVDLDMAYSVAASAGITINNNGVIDANNGYELAVDGDFNNNGDVQGQLKIGGDSKNIILGSVDYVEIYAPGQTISLGSDASVSHALTLSAGTLDAGVYLLTLESNSQVTGLIHDNGGTYVGEIVANRYIQNVLGHHFLGSPVQGATINQIHDDIPLLLTANYPNIYYYDETDPSPDYMVGWLTPSALSYAMAPGQGFTVYANASNAINVDFIGAPTTGVVSQTLTYTPSINPDPNLPYAEGWNLLSNPYPSPINFDDFSIGFSESVEEAYYTWDPNTSSYSSYVNGVGSPANFDQYIQMSQGFWLRTTADLEQVDFDNSIRVSDPTLISNPFLRSSNISTTPIARVSIVGEHSSCESVFCFKPDASPDFDNKFDAHYLKGEQYMLVELASVLSNKGKMRINSNPLQQSTQCSVQLFHKVSELGDYSIKNTEFENFITGTGLYLEDQVDGVFHDLLSSAYYFRADENDPEDRFILHFGNIPSNVVATEGIQSEVFSCGDQICIHFSEALDKDSPCVLVDQLGRVLTSVVIPAGTQQYQLQGIEQVANQLYFLQLPNIKQTHKVQF